MKSKVTIGFSKPYVANYKYDKETGVTYSDPTVLARGVEVQIQPETNDDNNFYADNAIAESEAGEFTGGSLNLTVDGLSAEGDQMIYGTPEPDTEGWTAHGLSTKIPEVGFGYIAKTKCKGVVSYEPTVIARCSFIPAEESAATEEESVSWQTQGLQATIKRSECKNKDWKYRGKEYETEEAAEAALVAFLSKTIE